MQNTGVKTDNSLTFFRILSIQVSMDFWIPQNDFQLWLWNGEFGTLAK